MVHRRPRCGAGEGLVGRMAASRYSHRHCTCCRDAKCGKQSEFLFCAVAQKPNCGLGRQTVEVPTILSHPVGVLWTTDLLSIQQTHIHVLSRIRTCDPSIQATTVLRLRARSQRDRYLKVISELNRPEMALLTKRKWAASGLQQPPFEIKLLTCKMKLQPNKSVTFKTKLSAKCSRTQ